MYWTWELMLAAKNLEGWHNGGMSYVDLPGVRLWYTDTGSGVPVVLMHAASGTTDSWVNQVPAFTAAGYRCITYDRRGWGRSEVKPEDEQPGSASGDLKGLLDHLGLDRFHLVGQAAGGAGALDFALSFPERVRCLVLCDGTSGVVEPEYLEYRERSRPHEIEALPVYLRELSATYRGDDPEGMKRWIEIEHHARPTGKTEVNQKARNRITYDLLKTLKVPTRVIVGDADISTPPGLMRRFAAHIPDCDFHTIAEAGHAAFWEKPEEWNRLVLEFIGQH